MNVYTIQTSDGRRVTARAHTEAEAFADAARILGYSRAEALLLESVEISPADSFMRKLGETALHNKRVREKKMNKSKAARYHDAEFRLWNFVTSRTTHFAGPVSGRLISETLITPEVRDKVIRKACRLSGKVQAWIE